MTRVVTSKLALYASVATALLCAGVAAGRVELVALAAAPLTAIVAGLALARPRALDASLALSQARCLEGEELEAVVELSGDARTGADIAIALSHGLAPCAGTVAAAWLGDDGTAAVALPLAARRWGLARVGPVAVRAESTGGLVSFERVFDLAEAVRIYPAAERLRKELSPPQTQVFTGNYVSRAAGDGLEFASVRPFAPGDSRKRVNWRVTSRRRELHVNEFHPERNADVVLFLDSFADVGEPPNTSLDLSVRAAVALARHYLGRKDRVGLVAFGGLLGWITTGTGQAHLYRIVDYLIGVQATLSYARKDIQYLPRRSLPQLALVVALSPLLDERALQAFVDLHARGFTLVVVDTLPETSIQPRPTAEDRLAFRVWRLARAARRGELQAAGIPVVSWTGELPLETIAAQLPPLERMPRARRA
ncbi:MAG TPA: DUF58 domain-containing protein [Actinomycetota bacterium]|nr:DUF58 domain-containing protein [Actinomycetota bacterium]